MRIHRLFFRLSMMRMFSNNVACKEPYLIAKRAECAGAAGGVMDGSPEGQDAAGDLVHDSQARRARAETAQPKEARAAILITSHFSQGRHLRWPTPRNASSAS